MRKPTIYEIKAGYEKHERFFEREPYFFSRDTMRFFHETLEMLTVEAVGDEVFCVQTLLCKHYFKRIGKLFIHLGTEKPIPKGENHD